MGVYWYKSPLCKTGAEMGVGVYSGVCAYSEYFMYMYMYIVFSLIWTVGTYASSIVASPYLILHLPSYTRPLRYSISLRSSEFSTQSQL